MNDNNANKNDSIMEEHLTAMMNSPIVEGPSSEIFTATLAMLQRAPVERPSLRQRSQHFLETLIMLSHQPLIRVALIAIACGVLYLLLLSPFGTSVALADVAAKLKEARTLVYTTTTTMAKGSPTVSKIYMGEQGRFRDEVEGTSVMITKDQRTLMLLPFNHTATQLDIQGEPKGRGASIAGSMVEWFKHLGDGDAKPIGEKKIDGVDVKGFTTSYAGVPAIVWADAKTAMPVRIELNMLAGGQDVTMVMSDFKLDVPLDDSLFSLDLPPGYTLTKKETMNLPKLGAVENEVAKLVGDYAKLNDNQFPENLTDWYGIIKGFTKTGQQMPMDDAGRVGGISGKLFSLPNGYGYAGKGVKLGEKDKLIFWIKPIDGQKTIRGVYGDLRVEDVPVDKLPTTQPTP